MSVRRSAQGKTNDKRYVRNDGDLKMITHIHRLGLSLWNLLALNMTASRTEATRNRFVSFFAGQDGRFLNCGGVLPGREVLHWIRRRIDDGTPRILHRQGP